MVTDSSDPSCDLAVNCAVCCTRLGDAGSHALECGHRFHVNCIVTWFRQQSSKGQCPLCRGATRKCAASTTMKARLHSIMKSAKRPRCAARTRREMRRVLAARGALHTAQGAYEDFLSTHEQTLQCKKRLEARLQLAKQNCDAIELNACFKHYPDVPAPLLIFSESLDERGGGVKETASP